MTYILINSGSGAVPKATLREAWKNIRVFRAELAQRLKCSKRDLTIERIRGKDRLDGRYLFRLDSRVSKNAAPVDVEMPGCAMALIVGSTAFAPRLYVDGSSWYWEFALNITADLDWF